ncbi:MAG TPA: Stp1/IreP family PP2C-type Ser/Thr phosphatase [Bacteroidota bacterium]|nr:Stp1/IreP family PP2C-type Ser/Thr phosphatase [Bacteroidota bacterium]
MKTLTYAAKTDIGRVREENQDAVGKFPDGSVDLDLPKGQLFVIADGMGGHAGGQQASRLAVETIGRTYFAANAPIIESLKLAFQEANRAIYDCSVNHPQFYGMGTTCIAFVLHNGKGYAAHIGDSRLYRITRDGIVQLTNDHSKVAEMVRRGILTAEEARWHPERSMLYRAMGVTLNMQFDLLNDISVGTDDYFVMCTDGLSSLVEPGEIQDIVVGQPEHEACENLVRLANERGGYDNITVQIIHVKGENSFLKTLLRSK